MELFSSIEDLFEASPQFMCVLDRDLRYLYTNAAHKKLFSGRDLTGLTVFEAQPELKGSPYLDMVKKVLEQGKNISVKESPLVAGEELRYIDMIYHPRKNAEGIIDGLFAMGTDVTETVVGRARIEENENLLRIITNKVPAYISYTDPAGRYKFLNENYANWFGVSPEAFVGKTREEIIPDGYVSMARKNTAIAFESGSSHHDVILQKPDGKLMNLEVNYFSDVDQRGKVRGMVAVGVDVTEKLEQLKKIENSRKELRELLDQIPYPLCVITGEERTFLMANRSFETYNARKVEGRTMAQVFVDDDVSHFEEVIDKVYATGEPHSIHGAPYVSKNAEGRVIERFVDAHYYPYKNEHQEQIGVFIIVLDVTEEISGRRKIEALATHLQEAVIARDNFMALASHELKTPLTSMRLMTQLQVRKNTDPAENKFLAHSLKQINRLTRLVDDMLDISRIGQSKLEMKISEVNLSQLIYEAFEKLLPQLRELGNKVSFEIPDGVMAKIDPERFEQVFTNLATNAARYATGTEVKVSLIQETSRLIIEVEDKGQGIPEDQLEKIFDRFEQGGKNAGGFGLGLYICREIVEAHGGSITAATNQFGGATFRIVLPRVSV